MPKNFTNRPIHFAVWMPHAPVLIPDIGGGRIVEVARSVQSMRTLSRHLVSTEPLALVVVSPHSPRRAGAFGIWRDARMRGSLSNFGAPMIGVDLPTNPELARTIAAEASERGLETWEIIEPELDHGAVVPLWFLVEAGWKGPVVVTGLDYPGRPGAAEFGATIASAAATFGGRMALIASGDMSHRLTPTAPCGYEPRAREFDRWLVGTVRSGDYHRLCKADHKLESLAAEDSLDSLLVACGATGFDSTGHEVFSYEGPFGVGYGVAVLFDAAGAEAPARKEAA
jgi:aromatic ring-opening dioxygenase LigB subunit